MAPLTYIQTPVYERPPANAHQGADRAAEHAIYTLKNKLSYEHNARTDHDAGAAPVTGCETCAFIVAGVNTTPMPPGKYWDSDQGRLIEYPREPLPR